MNEITIKLSERASAQLTELRHKRGDKSEGETVRTALKVLRTLQNKTDAFGYVTILYKGNEMRLPI